VVVVVAAAVVKVSEVDEKVWVLAKNDLPNHLQYRPHHHRHRLRPQTRAILVNFKFLLLFLIVINSCNVVFIVEIYIIRLRDRL
jgi:hypothetical protein